ncbi:MAG TPA: 3-phosphoserine/phosphohydroxythreonine transaminase [Anaerolineales bacterium]|nr:3-phosphoserine/phosphohydroxythreonine transaminase [Anaerolineales bacterium]
MTVNLPYGRVYNFNAGPAALPVVVLEQVQAELLNYKGTGMSVMEMSHRSKAFEGILHAAESDLRALYGIGADYAVIFMQGGASLQFTAVPANLRGAGQSADYLVTGSWSKAAYKEAKRHGATRVAWDGGPDGFVHIPRNGEASIDAQAAYAYVCSNETVNGLAYYDLPHVPAEVPLVCDASSEFVSRPLDVARYGLLYGGAQKNAGPAGVTVVIIRRDLLERTPEGLPPMLDYKLLSEHGSLYNTPPCFGIYVTGLVFQWILAQGGLTAIAEANRRKSTLVYQAIDASGGFYRGHARPDSRSDMNVTFRLPDAALEEQFAKTAKAEGLEGLKGHRSVGGIRASLYNAVPLDAASLLADFMREFQRRNG